MKIQVCDLCYEKKIYTPATKYFKLRKTGCRIDVCPEHNSEVKALTSIEFVKTSYRVGGTPIGDDMAKTILAGAR